MVKTIPGCTAHWKSERISRLRAYRTTNTNIHMHTDSLRSLPLSLSLRNRNDLLLAAVLVLLILACVECKPRISSRRGFDVSVCSTITID